MAGRGEHVKRVANLPQIAMVLVNPGVAVPTAPVFGSLNSRTGIGTIAPPPGNIETLWDLVAYLDDAVNDLEAPACRIAPEIEHVLESLENEPGCVMAQMSGSGATCFALFDGRHFALGAAERVAMTVTQGVHGRRRVGSGEAFWQFRRYQPGDGADQIDWRQTAKTDRVYVRETEWEAAQSIWLWCEIGRAHV